MLITVVSVPLDLLPTTHLCCWLLLVGCWLVGGWLLVVVGCWLVDVGWLGGWVSALPSGLRGSSPGELSPRLGARPLYYLKVEAFGLQPGPLATKAADPRALLGN